MKLIHLLTLKLQDLIKQTPEDHADYELLTNVLNSTKEFLARVSGDDRDGAVCIVFLLLTVTVVYCGV